MLYFVADKKLRIALFLVAAGALAQLPAVARPRPQPFAYGPSTPALENGPGMRLTRKMDREIGLVEHQFIRLLPLNRQHLADRQAIETRFANDAFARREQLTVVDRRYESSYREFLYPRQLQLLGELHEALMPGVSFRYFLNCIFKR